MDNIESPSTLLDFGCGTAGLFEYIKQQYPQSKIEYTGLDMGELYIERCKSKFPDNDFLNVDILKEPDKLNNYDYVVMNGVFTEKLELTHQEMFEYFKSVIKILFPKVNRGIAFNVMSKAVDWERDDLFHLETDELITFLTKEITRDFVIRNDYGLYEYFVYLKK